MTVYTVCALDCNTFVLVLSNVTDDLCLLGTYFEEQCFGVPPFFYWGACNLSGKVYCKRLGCRKKLGLYKLERLQGFFL